MTGSHNNYVSMSEFEILDFWTPKISLFKILPPTLGSVHGSLGLVSSVEELADRAKVARRPQWTRTTPGDIVSDRGSVQEHHT